MWNILPTLLTFIFSFYFHSILGNKKICQANVTYGEWLGVKHFLATNRGWKTWKKHFVGGELPVCWCSNLAHPTIIRNLCDCVTHIIGDLGNDLWLVLPNRYLLPVRVLDSWLQRRPWLPRMRPLQFLVSCLAFSRCRDVEFLAVP